MYYDSYFKAKPTSLGHAMNIQVNKILIKKINNYFASENEIKICEVGYGRGLFADALRENCKNKIDYYAIEPNHFLAMQGRAKGDHIVEAKIPPFPTNDEWKNFDVIMFSHVMEHFSDYETVLTVLEESGKQLNDNGIVIVFFPDYLDYKEDFFSCDYSHAFIITLRRMMQLFNDTHFQVVEKGMLRSCFSFPLSSLIYPIHLLIKGIAGILWNLTSKELFFKMKITFAKNIFMVAKKDKNAKSICQ